MKKTMKRKYNVTRDLEEIYEAWGDGPSADDYYNAVTAYFKSKEPVSKREEYESVGQTRGK
jgi:hypothetical protein